MEHTASGDVQLVYEVLARDSGERGRERAGTMDQAWLSRDLQSIQHWVTHLEHLPLQLPHARPPIRTISVIIEDTPVTRGVSALTIHAHSRAPCLCCFPAPSQRGWPARTH